MAEVVPEKCQCCRGDWQEPQERLERGLWWAEGFGDPIPAWLCKRCTQEFWCPAEFVTGRFRTREAVRKYVNEEKKGGEI